MHALEPQKQKFLAKLENEDRLQPSSLRIYASEIEQFFRTCPDPKNSEAFFQALHSKSTATVRRKFGILKQFLKDCPAPWREIFDEKRQPKLRQKQPTFLTEKEVFLLESAAYRSKSPLRDRLFIAFGTQLGLRLAEILRLRFSDIEESWLKILRKGGKEQRLPLSKSLESLIVLFRKERRAEIGDLIFEGQTGKALSSRAAQKLLKRIAKEAGIQKNISPHALRHSFASKMAAKGVSLAVVKEFLGHERLTTTERYLHVTPEYLQQALRQTEGIH